MPTEKKLPVAVVVIAKNEERRIADCLKSVSWAGEIIVVDDESIDRTAELACGLGARVYRRTMDIEGRQRNFGFEQAAQPWILSLDADERVTPQLAREIQEVLKTHEKSPGVVGFAIPIKTFIGSRWVRGAGYYPARKARLFRKGRFRYEEAGVHPRALYEGRIIELQGDILHYSCRDLGEFIRKFDRETTLEAEKWLLDRRKISFLKALRKTLDRFLKNYFLKGGWRDGGMGFVMSLFHGFYQLIGYAKYRERRGRLDRVVFVDRDGVVNEDLFDYVRRWEDFRFYDGVLEGLKRLVRAGYKVVLISNQAGVGDGVYSEKALWEIHQNMLKEFERAGVHIHAAYYCLHGKEAGCGCRKPRVGLFRRAAEDGLCFDKSKTYFLGDKASDMEAGKNFGLRTILIRTGYGSQHEAVCCDVLRPDAVVNNFQEAVDRVLCG